MDTVTVGLVGAGYASQLHCSGYRKVHGASVRLKTICDVDAQRAEKMASSHGIEGICRDYRELLADKEVDLIDICTPPDLHAHMIKDALSAGKHVICEKPLTGYFGVEGDPLPIGKAVSKRKMYEKVSEEVGKLLIAVKASDRQFMYAENYVYAPTVRKAAEIIESKKSRILFMKDQL